MKMNVPNALTILRICLVPVFVLFMLTGIGGSYGDIIAGVIFIIASLTDTLDGHIARKYDQITVFGASTKRVTVITPFLTIILVVLLVTLIKKTKIGMAMRAASKDFETVAVSGLPSYIK